MTRSLHARSRGRSARSRPASRCGTPASAQEVNLYTTREPGLIQPLIDSFTKATGIKVNSIFVKDGLTERVAAEGTRSPADVLMTVDIGALVDLVEKGLTQPVKFGCARGSGAGQPARERRLLVRALAARARRVRAQGSAAVVVDVRGAGRSEVEGKVCTRAGQHPYNTALDRCLHRASRRSQAPRPGSTA